MRYAGSDAFFLVLSCGRNLSIHAVTLHSLGMKRTGVHIHLEMDEQEGLRVLTQAAQFLSLCQDASAIDLEVEIITEVQTTKENCL